MPGYLIWFFHYPWEQRHAVKLENGFRESFGDKAVISRHFK